MEGCGSRMPRRLPLSQPAGAGSPGCCRFGRRGCVRGSTRTLSSATTLRRPRCSCLPGFGAAWTRIRWLAARTSTSGLGPWSPRRHLRSTSRNSQRLPSRRPTVPMTLEAWNVPPSKPPASLHRRAWTPRASTGFCWLALAALGCCTWTFQTSMPRAVSAPRRGGCAPSSQKACWWMPPTRQVPPSASRRAMATRSGLTR
mmetsp:Transcript_178509/g.572026  ORF Transcript_178509/g.572026 Transcript_178509/m.572026 type:complete len:200 (-) Transcript_178509:1279-1878(-)